MKMTIKTEIDKNTFVELPLQCIKEVGTIDYDEAIMQKWIDEVEIIKQFQYINDVVLAVYVYDMGCDLSLDEVKKLPREELIKWALREICLDINEEL